MSLTSAHYFPTTQTIKKGVSQGGNPRRCDTHAPSSKPAWAAIPHIERVARQRFKACHSPAFCSRAACDQPFGNNTNPGRSIDWNDQIRIPDLSAFVCKDDLPVNGQSHRNGFRDHLLGLSAAGLDCYADKSDGARATNDAAAIMIRASVITASLCVFMTSYITILNRPAFNLAVDELCIR